MGSDSESLTTHLQLVELICLLAERGDQGHHHALLGYLFVKVPQSPSHLLAALDLWLCMCSEWVCVWYGDVVYV